MFRKILSLNVIISFILTGLGPLPQAHANLVAGLPQPGVMINLSPAYEPVMIKGLTIHKDNPFLFDFIVDVGQDRMSGEPLKKEGEKLIKYFLASLAIPDKDVWVNLSPYEKNRMIPEALGQTELGRDLLEQDYILKQITASLIYPEKKLGKIFWDRVYAKAQQMYGTTQVPVNTFNKVWIVSDRAEVLERNQTVFVSDSHLKVMLEEDYLALQKHSAMASMAHRNDIHSIGANIVRQIVLPELEKEINQGKNFANLRQIFNSIILSSWYKDNLKQALLNQVYANHSTVKGINLNDPTIKEQIYEQYLKAYKKGVFNYIKEDVNAASGETIPKKYFSGGILEAEGPAAHPTKRPLTSEGQLGNILDNPDVDFTVLTSPAMASTVTSSNVNSAMLGNTTFVNSTSALRGLKRVDVVRQQTELLNILPGEIRKTLKEIAQDIQSKTTKQAPARLGLSKLRKVEPTVTYPNVQIDDDINALMNMIKLVGDVYDKMGEMQQNGANHEAVNMLSEGYHNMAHNLNVTWANLLFAQGKGLIKTREDMILATMAPLLHDFHVRSAFTDDGKRTPALVEETVRQLGYLLGAQGYENYKAVKGSSSIFEEFLDKNENFKKVFPIKMAILLGVKVPDNITSYMERIIELNTLADIQSGETTRIIQKTQKQVTPLINEYKERLGHFFPLMIAPIRRTDFPSNVTLPFIFMRYKGEYIAIRKQYQNELTARGDALSASDIEKWIGRLNNIFEGMVLNIEADPINNSKIAEDQKPALRKSAVAWIRRVQEIEINYLNALKIVPQDRMSSLNSMSKGLTLADMSVSLWLATPKLTRKITLGLNRETPIATVLGNYFFFYMPELLNKEELHEFTSYLPAKEQEKFLKNIEYFAAYAYIYIDTLRKLSNEDTAKEVMDRQLSEENLDEIPPLDALNDAKFKMSTMPAGTTIFQAAAELLKNQAVPLVEGSLKDWKRRKLWSYNILGFYWASTKDSPLPLKDLISRFEPAIQAFYGKDFMDGTLTARDLSYVLAVANTEDYKGETLNHQLDMLAAHLRGERGSNGGLNINLMSTLISILHETRRFNFPGDEKMKTQGQNVPLEQITSPDLALEYISLIKNANSLEVRQDRKIQLILDEHKGADNRVIEATMSTFNGKDQSKFAIYRYELPAEGNEPAIPVLRIKKVSADGVVTFIYGHDWNIDEDRTNWIKELEKAATEDKLDGTDTFSAKYDEFVNLFMVLNPASQKIEQESVEESPEAAKANLELEAGNKAMAGEVLFTGKEVSDPQNPGNKWWVEARVKAGNKKITGVGKQPVEQTIFIIEFNNMGSSFYDQIPVPVRISKALAQKVIEAIYLNHMDALNEFWFNLFHLPDGNPKAAAASERLGSGVVSTVFDTINKDPEIRNVILASLEKEEYSSHTTMDAGRYELTINGFYATLRVEKHREAGHETARDVYLDVPSLGLDMQGMVNHVEVEPSIQEAVQAVIAQNNPNAQKAMVSLKFTKLAQSLSVLAAAGLLCGAGGCATTGENQEGPYGHGLNSYSRDYWRGAPPALNTQPDGTLTRGQHPSAEGWQPNITPAPVNRPHSMLNIHPVQKVAENTIPVGGIDLNTSNGMQWKISKDGLGVEMNIDPVMIERFRREGIKSLSEIILKMTPVASIWSMVGH